MLTVPDAARIAEVDPETVRRWIRAGRLVARKVGSQYLIAEADLAESINGLAPSAPVAFGHRTGESATPYGVGEAVPGERQLTVSEAARRARRNPETVRRWVREGKLPATRAGTQVVIDEHDLAVLLGEASDTLPMPDAWRRTFWGGPMPDVVAILRRQRDEH
jgi:excisionase family DNA binding protein